MSIQVSGNTVITNDAKLQNISGADGKYDAFIPRVTTITDNIDFNTPMMVCNMTQNTIFTESNKLLGRSVMILLDTSASLYTPTFSTSVKWSTGIEPNWLNYRHWQIVLQATTPTEMRGVAVGYTFNPIFPDMSAFNNFNPSDLYVLGITASDPNKGAGCVIVVAADGDIHADTRGNDGIFNQLATDLAPIGRWLPSGATASDYELKYETTAPTGSASNSIEITNNASTFKTMSSNHSLDIFLPSTSAPGSAFLNITITLRQKNNTNVFSTYTYSFVELTFEE